MNTKQIYKSYITSSEWNDVRSKYKKNYCELCFSPFQLTLHHLHYKTLTQESEEDLVTLCWTCHKAFHINMKSSKRLRTPSKGLARMVIRLRAGKKISLHKRADFLRRRYIIVHGENNLPDFNYFIKEANNFAFLKRQPTTMAISH